MAEQTIVIGNATIVLNGPNDPFHDGYTTGYLEFYDERHLPFFSPEQPYCPGLFSSDFSRANTSRIMERQTHDRLD
jgi:hypothetical protein